MKIEILEHKKNPLMKREEAWVSVEHPGGATPRRAEILAGLAKKLGAKPELVIIDKIFSETGKALTRVRVQVYKSKEGIPKFKLEKMERRMKKAEKKKEEKPAPPAEAKPAEAPKEEKPAEEKPKEEAKPEEKKE